jgi:hypothetical protein
MRLSQKLDFYLDKLDSSVI